MNRNKTRFYNNKMNKLNNGLKKIRKECKDSWLVVIKMLILHLDRWQ
jgi:hypothetical protein